MKNGIRQCSVISPYLFNVCVDDLNVRLSAAKVGCHVANQTANNFSHADEMATVTPSLMAINQLQKFCEKFASEDYIVYSTAKSVCIRIQPQNCTAFARPNLYLCGTVLSYVEDFKYLGHFITEKFSDTKRHSTGSLQPQFNRLHGHKEIYVLLRGGIMLFIQNVLFSLYSSSLWAR